MWLKAWIREKRGRERGEGREKSARAGERKREEIERREIGQAAFEMIHYCYFSPFLMQICQIYSTLKRNTHPGSGE